MQLLLVLFVSGPIVIIVVSNKASPPTAERVHAMLNQSNTIKSSKGVSLARSVKAPVIAPVTTVTEVKASETFSLVNGQPISKASLVAWCNVNAGGYTMANLHNVKINVLPSVNMSGDATVYKGNRLPFGYGKLGGARAMYQDALLNAPTLGAFMSDVAGKQKGYNEFSTAGTVLALLNGGYGSTCRAGHWGTPFITLSV